MARPTKYQKAYAEQARKLCLLGYTDAELADFFEVSEQTINAWKKAQPAFLESIKKGKDLADGEVVDSLYQRALGYVAPDLDIRVINDQIVKTNIKKHYPPDPVSAIFWLRNRQRNKWHNNPEPGDNNIEPTPVQINVSVVDARADDGDKPDS
jgi:DNA-binding XRE family transcriptional regulator